METKEFNISGMIPPHDGEISFNRIEVLASEYSPVALVWYTILGDDVERATRIDLQKQAFLDDLGSFANDSLGLEAGMISEFLWAKKSHERGVSNSSNRTMAVTSASSSKY